MFFQMQVQNPNFVQIGIAGNSEECLTLSVTKVGNVIRRLREAKHLSQDALGALANSIKKSGVNGQTISNIETGKVNRPSNDSYRAIAQALDTTIEAIEADAESEPDHPLAGFIALSAKKRGAFAMQLDIKTLNELSELFAHAAQAKLLMKQHEQTPPPSKSSAKGKDAG